MCRWLYLLHRVVEMGADESRRRIVEGNGRLKHMVAGQTLDLQMLKAVVSKKW